MSDDLVTRLRTTANKTKVRQEDTSEFEQSRIYTERLLGFADHLLIRVEQQRDLWKRIAGDL